MRSTGSDQPATRKLTGPNTVTMRMNWGHASPAEHAARANSVTRAVCVPGHHGPPSPLGPSATVTRSPPRTAGIAAECRATHPVRGVPVTASAYAVVVLPCRPALVAATKLKRTIDVAAATAGAIASPDADAVEVALGLEPDGRLDTVSPPDPQPATEAAAKASPRAVISVAGARLCGFIARGRRTYPARSTNASSAALPRSVTGSPCASRRRSKSSASRRR